MKRKVKRFNEGGDYESSDDYKNLEAAATREKNEYLAGETAKTEPLKMASFKEAFAEARGRGDKSFEYMGKKYTTEMAKPKVAAPKTEAVETPKARSFADKQEAAGEKMRGAYRGVAENIKKMFTPTADNPRIRRERAELAAQGMKKGGSVKTSSASKRADGIAQRGKTRGKMI